MPKEIVLPELAESVVEGEILKWLVGEGEPIKKDQPFVEVMTDKVTVELPSPYEGVLLKQLVQEGQVVAVHAAIATVAEAGEAVPVSAKPKAPLNVQAAEERSIVEAGQVPEDDGASLSLFKPDAKQERVKNPFAQSPQNEPTVPGPSTVQGRIIAVPAARKLAREMGIDLSQIQGSGPTGRIRVEDVKAHAQRPATPTAAASGLPSPVQYKTPKGYEALETRVPLRGLRRMIANQMAASHLYTVRTLTVDEIDMTELVNWRSSLKADAEAQGVKISYLPFIFKALGIALRKFPSLNSSMDEAKQEIVLKNYVNMGMAVATEAGLVVPVVRDINQKPLLQIAKEIGDLADKARSGKLSPEDMSGSSFSVTNIGSIGALFSFPIINVPDAAILGIHSIQKRPVVDQNDAIVVRHMMYISLSFDHRLVDGAEAARFCKELIRLLEKPERLMLEML
jgi:2-oxoisovalerate dehydrogenase E2 component (dihydrolipoyl transacylase)